MGVQNPKITFRDFTPSPAVTFHVERRAAKLQTIFDRVVDCHVVVEEPHRHSAKGKKFHVRINLHVPGKELVITKNLEDCKEDLHVAIDDAFGDAERVLESHARKVEDGVKPHSRPSRGIVARVFSDEGYGFIEAEGDGHDVYFHRNSIVDGGRFERVSVGTKVRFAEEDGDLGPQASTVHLLNGHH